MSERFSLHARWSSFRYALAGLRSMLSDQHNARIHFAATVAVLGLSAALGLSRLEWCWIVAAIGAVWALEALNTAIESLADAVAPDPHPLSRSRPIRSSCSPPTYSRSWACGHCISCWRMWPTASIC